MMAVRIDHRHLTTGFERDEQIVARRVEQRGGGNTAVIVIYAGRIVFGQAGEVDPGADGT